MSWIWQTYLTRNPGVQSQGAALWNQLSLLDQSAYLADEVSWAGKLIGTNASSSAPEWIKVLSEWKDWLAINPGVRLLLLHNATAAADRNSGVNTNQSALNLMLPVLLVNYATGGVSAGFTDTPAYRTLFWTDADKILRLYPTSTPATGNNLGTPGTTGATGTPGASGSSGGSGTSGGAGIALLLLGALVMFGGKK